ELLRTILRSNLGDRWTQLAVLNSLSNQGGQFLAGLVRAKSSFTWNGAENGIGSFLHQLAVMIGTRHEPDEVQQVLETFRHLEGRCLVCGLASALGEGLQRAGSSLAAVSDSELFNRLLQIAHTLLADQSAPEAERFRAIQLLGQGRWDHVREPLRSVLQPGE